MFRVIEFFTDLQDGNHAYNVGDTFPREGVTVTADRIKELSGTQNKRGIALIEEVREAAETADAEEPADKSVSVENEPRKRTRKRKTEE
jgi:hypothetical protein